MIILIYSIDDCIAAEIVYKALVRSFAFNQVTKQVLSSSNDHVNFKKPGVFVFINPKSDVIKQVPDGSKVIVFGKLNQALSNSLACELFGDYPEIVETSEIIFNHDYFAIKQRRLVRFDFEREWNNLGFGGIVQNQSIWGVAQNAHSNNAIATIHADQNRKIDYVTLTDFTNKSCLWVNREAGLVDTINWQCVEKFVSHYRVEDLVAYAYLLDIPAGMQAAVTMRLDCDESIVAAEPLFKAYQEKKVPFSLAIKTSLSIENQEIALMQQVLKSGGSILSHSVNHKVSWGDDYQDAYKEALTSRYILSEKLNEDVKFAVSPFHSNKTYSIKALEDAGYQGFVGGIICNDPEYLMARGGLVPFGNQIVSHSQQCMLHGDCYLKDENDPMRVYKEAFDLAYKSNTFFGFLDHPFSERYQYGWDTEMQRVQAHMELIDYMRSKAEVSFINLNDCLNFMADKSKAMIEYQRNGKPVIKMAGEKQSHYDVATSLQQEALV